MDDPTILFRVHAIQQMFARSISEVEVRAVLEDDDAIETYPDEPHPTKLLLGHVSGRPLHVVAALDHSSDTIIVITVYEPDRSRWEDGFRSRRKP